MSWYHEMKASKKRQKIKLSQKHAELSYWESVLCDTRDLFHAYDMELADFLRQLELAEGEIKAEELEELEEKSLAKIEKKKSFKERISDQDFKEPERIEQNSSCPPWMKKAFKAIALKTHPDKVLFRDDLSELEKEALIKKYSAAADAMASSSGITLLEIAQSLEIELDVAIPEQINMLENKVDKIKKEIQDYHTMVSWSWGENEGNIDVRANLLVYVRNYLKKPALKIERLKDFIKKYENEESLVVKNRNINKIPSRPIGSRPGPGISQLRKK